MKPSLKTNLRHGQKDGYTGVCFWFEVEAKGIRLKSEPHSAQTQHSGKFNVGPEGNEQHRFWTDDTVARLSATYAQFHRFLDNLTTAAKNVSAAMNNLERGPRQTTETSFFGGLFNNKQSTPRAAFDDARRQFDEARRHHDGSLQQLNVIEQEMATPDFMSFFANVPLPLQVDDAPSDEKAYALYRGSVWSCSRELEPEQWRILADDYVAREEAEFAQALGVLPQPQADNREGIPTAVRRAVWARDNGRCAKCSSRERLEYDHIIPVSKGGSNTERNIELLCEACNRAKSDSII
jgi:hypothetical protein